MFSTLRSGLKCLSWQVAGLEMFKRLIISKTILEHFIKLPCRKANHLKTSAIIMKFAMLSGLPKKMAKKMKMVLKAMGHMC